MGLTWQYLLPQQVKASQTEKQLHLLWTTELRTNNGLWEKLQVLEALLEPMEEEPFYSQHVRLTNTAYKKVAAYCVSFQFALLQDTCHYIKKESSDNQFSLLLHQKFQVPLLSFLLVTLSLQ